jgi:hypothetical protein
MEVATATHTTTEAAPPQPEDGTQNRTAHTLTACCRCRTVSPVHCHSPPILF